MLYLPQTVRRVRVFAPKVHQQKPLFVCVAHLHGQIVQALVVLGLRDRAVFMEGLQGGHLPVVESPALFLRGQSLPRRLVRCVHRATILPAGIVPCCCVGFKYRFKVAGYLSERRFELPVPAVVCTTGKR